LTIKAENKTTTRTGFSLQNNLHVFGLLWLVTFALYLPTVKAGWVFDAIGWINDMKTHNFWDFINRKESTSGSFYQLFALQYYVCYRLWGMNMWLWSLLYMTVHSLNAALLFIVCRNVLRDSGLQKNIFVSFCGVLLYVVCPHISEVVVWKACFHYIMGFSFILFSLLMVQKYQHQQRGLYIIGALFVFCLSAFGLEIFYLTPFLGLSIALFYRFVLGYDRHIFRKTISFFFIPQMMLFCLYFIGIFAAYKFIQPHATNLSSVITGNLSKPIKYIFHILFFGRFFPDETRRYVYHLCNSTRGILVFYTLFALAVSYAAIRFRRMNITGKFLVLLFIWIACSITLTLPVWFPEDSLVAYDRYTYLPDAFIYVFLALFINSVFGGKVFMPFILVYGMICIFFTLKVNRYWRQSAHIVNSLVRTFPNDPSKTVLLLDMPNCMRGVDMIVARDDDEFKTMYNIMMPVKINNSVYDVESYYLQNTTDGAHINVVNDSIVQVTLNQWGTWWLYYGFGSRSYENKDFKVNMIDEGHMYELILKRPINQYLLLYEVGDQWKIADQQKKNVDQF